MSRSLRLAALLFAAAGLAHGQMPIVPGEPALAPKVRQAQLRVSPAQPKPTAVLSPVSDAEVALVRAANQRSATKQQARRVLIGIQRGAPAREMLTAAQLVWNAVPGGHAAQAAVTSPGASALRLAIELAGVPEDVEMVFFGSGAPQRLEGPVRVGEVKDRIAAWWSPVTEGETQTVEFFVPAGRDPAALPLRIARASHLFTSPSSRFAKRVADIGTSGSCNVDVPCSSLNSSAAFQNIVDSVAQMVYNIDQFIGLCTGTLLADSNGASQVPYFFSANHCFDNVDPPYKTPAQMQAVANSLTTLWNFEAASCGSQSLSSAWSQVSGGATLLYSNVQSDVLFVRLNNSPPAGSFYAGWDANALSVNTPVIAVHHPQGDLKKVSQGTVQGFVVQGVGGGSQSFIESRWSSGTTEAGSSGGGLFTLAGSQYFLRGGLWGGAAQCTNPTGIDLYSRFDQVYGSLAPYLSGITPSANYTDLWWNPGESGWGLNLTQHPSNVIFGVWYTYELDGTRTWFVIPAGTWTNANTYTGPLYATAGPAYSQSFNPSLVTQRQVGTVTLTFSDSSHGTFAYSVDGVAGVKSITRQPY